MTREWTRREWLQAGAAGATASCLALPAFGAPRAAAKRPNVLFIMTDQQGLDTFSCLGCRDVSTPNMDRLASRGTAFLESYTANPVCSPARSAMLTGRPTLETGVVKNGRPIRSTMPNLGQWLRQEGGYETVYAGKWHLPASYTATIPGFEVITTGINGQGGVCDAHVSRACESYLYQHRQDAARMPFCLVASFLQPHDICQFVTMHAKGAEMPFFDAVKDQLPPLPANARFDPREPAAMKHKNRPAWNEQQWRYYLYHYYRMVEMVDAEIGRVLNALEDSGEAERTLIVFTADHGEGRGRHGLVTKNYLYDEAAKVPLVVAAPGASGNRRDTAHLVSGVDIVPTVCDYAGLAAPPAVRGRSLRPLLEGSGNTTWHEFVAAEATFTGRMIRTARFKYIGYANDPVEQLFDMQTDPGETRNLAPESRYADELAAHRQLLRDWEGGLDICPVPLPQWAQPRRR